jgi:hypothetical protein
MNTLRSYRWLRWVLWFGFAILTSTLAVAEAGDPPRRAARLAFVEGSVSFLPAGTQDWVAPYLNRPLTTGDQLWADNDGRAELQLDGSLLRVSANTQISFLNLGDTITQVQLSSGTLLLRVRRLNEDETYEVDTPNLAFSVLRPGLYRVSVDPSGSATTIAVRSGQGEVTGAGVAYPVHASENDVFSGTDQLVENSQPEAGQDAFDAWSAERDSRWDRSVSARYVPPDVVGYTDLDTYGTWKGTPDYGTVWVPRGLEPGWAPYRNGHWAYVEPWGYTWVDDSPWGFAPFHYGRWVYVGGAWGWVPPPLAPRGEYRPCVYAPALVAWVSVGAGVAWFALGPREVYVPSYPVSRTYVNNVNISNTTVNNTVVTNVYNTTIVNKTVTNVTYVNRSVPGAVVATSQQAFASAQPVARNRLRVDTRAVASAPVQSTTPPVVPSKQAVAGPVRAAARKPPVEVQQRAVVARTPPPPPPVPLERRLAAIRSNGGKPLSVAQTQQIAAAAPRPAPIKLAPPPRLMPARNEARPAPGSAAAVRTPAPPSPAAPVNTPRPPGRPNEPPAAVARPEPPRSAAPARPGEPPAPAARYEPPRPADRPVHPSEAPPVPKPPSPSAANSALERQHFQEQQRLAAQQNAERDRLQRQQEAQHQQLAEKARMQQLEEQHRAQTEQLAQRHAQEQQQIQARQVQERTRQMSPPPPPPPPPPKGGKEEHLPPR